MLIHKFCQNRCFLLLVFLILLIFSIINYIKRNNSINDLLFNKNNYLIEKIYEINDREPTYKLVTYEGYKFPLERNFAQTILTNQLELNKICKENPNITIIDIGASLG